MRTAWLFTVNDEAGAWLFNTREEALAFAGGEIERRMGEFDMPVHECRRLLKKGGVLEILSREGWGRVQEVELPATPDPGGGADQPDRGSPCRAHVAAPVAAMETWGSWEDGVPEAGPGESGQVGAAYDAAKAWLASAPTIDDMLWLPLRRTSPSGKALFVCTRCGCVSPTPDKTCPGCARGGGAR